MTVVFVSIAVALVLGGFSLMSLRIARLHEELAGAYSLIARMLRAGSMDAVVREAETFRRERNGA